MPEDTGSKEVNRIPDKSIFPVSKEAVDKALGGITQDPTKTMIREQSLMKQQNPALFATLDDYGTKLNNAEYFDFTTGACWTYKILRIQAEACGRQLPQISPALLSTYGRDYIQSAEESEKKGFIPFEERIKRIAAQDPEFGRAIKEFTKYRVAASGFYSGALQVYNLIENALQSEELERKFSIQTPESARQHKKDDTPKDLPVPVSEFLVKLTSERKLLSEEEKREAEVTAKDVWKKAMEKTGGKDIVFLQNPKTNQDIALYLGKKAQGLPGKDPKVDLVIRVDNFRNQQKPSRIIYDYCFNPDGVKKTTYDLSAMKPIDLNELLSINDPEKRAEIINRTKEQRTEETYEPNKDDLTDLLQNLSYAIPNSASS